MNFVQSYIAKIDEICQKCTIVVDWKNNFWIEAASFIGAGTVNVNIQCTYLSNSLPGSSNEQVLYLFQKDNQHHLCKYIVKRILKMKKLSHV